MYFDSAFNSTHFEANLRRFPDFDVGGGSRDAARLGLFVFVVLGFWFFVSFFLFCFDKLI